jgi:hypothetical protein
MFETVETTASSPAKLETESALLAQKQFIPDINKPVFSNGKMANIVLLPTAVQE